MQGIPASRAPSGAFADLWELEPVLLRPARPFRSEGRSPLQGGRRRCACWGGWRILCDDWPVVFGDVGA